MERRQMRYDDHDPADDIESCIIEYVHQEAIPNLEILLEQLKSETSFKYNPPKVLVKALMAAANCGSVVSMRLLLQHGADEVVDHANEFGNSPLVMAAIRSHGEIMSLLIEAGCSVNKTDQESRTALHWSAMNGDYKIAEELLHNGSIADHPDKIYGFTPLMQAARQGHTDIVKLLLEYNCDVNRTDMHRETPLFDAVRNNNIECMKALIEAGAKVDHLNRRGSSPIHTAVMYNRIEALKLLIHQNCQLDLYGDSTSLHQGERYTALEIGIQESAEIPCRLLVQAGASLRNLHKYLHMKTDTTFLSGRTVSSWIREVLERPRSLKEVARISIRAFYGTTLLEIVDNLPIPNALKLYMQMPEIQEIN